MEYRYQLPTKSVKSNCPNCGPNHRNTLSRYVDTKTDEPLPDQYGRCDRENNCCYHLSPYDKDESGRSYADRNNESNYISRLPNTFFKLAGKSKRNRVDKKGAINKLLMAGATLQEAEYVVDYIFQKKPNKASTPLIYTIPDELFTKSLGHYEQNQFARLLCQQFGESKAKQLLDQFQIGTSKRWPGACIFWYIDEKGRKRGGQIKLFDSNWHTIKYIDAEGNRKTKTSWVHAAYTYQLQQAKISLPDWLIEYNEKGKCSPCLFGLPQLLNAPIHKPIAIVEAPKTAVIGSAMMPDFIWLAVGALSYLNAERLSPLQDRTIKLFPDLSNEGKTFIRWNKTSDELQVKGYKISVSDYLENNATKDQKQAGSDLADFLLQKQGMQ